MVGRARARTRRSVAWPARGNGFTIRRHARCRESAMPIVELDHYFVRANDLEKTKQFYCDVLGLEVMPRPAFPFPGYWLGANGRIQVHMGPHGIPRSELYYLGTSAQSSTADSGVVDHVAFVSTEPAAFRERFDARGIVCRSRYFPQFKLYQMFVKDPDNVTIELNFHGIDDEPAWGGENYAEMPRAAETEIG
jgi:catechol 2,3-dioxygenase-like lactoylglutathione lyase family enzyme